MLPTLVRCKVELDPANCSIFWVKYQQNLLKILCSLIIRLLLLNPFSPPGNFFMHVNGDCSVQCWISRADTFLQVNCGQNGQSLFKDFVNLVSKLVMGGREKFKRDFLKSLLRSYSFQYFLKLTLILALKYLGQYFYFYKERFQSRRGNK